MEMNNFPGSIDRIVKESGDIVVISRVEYATLLQRASTDSLTGLKNKRCFEDQLLYDVRMARRDIQKGGSPDNVALLYFDLNGLKYVNDEYGHDVGDTVLKEFADLLKLYFRRASDTNARVGGDEFAALLPKTEMEEAWSMGRNIHKAARHLGILVAVGVANYRLSVEDPIVDGRYTRKFEDVVDELKQKADSGMYSNKRGIYRKITPQQFYDAHFQERGVLTMAESIAA